MSMQDPHKRRQSAVLAAQGVAASFDGIDLDAVANRVRERALAGAAQSDLSDKDKINLAMRELLGITDPDAGALMRFAASQLVAHADRLLRVKFIQGDN